MTDTSERTVVVVQSGIKPWMLIAGVAAIGLVILFSSGKLDTAIEDVSRDESAEADIRYLESLLASAEMDMQGGLSTSPEDQVTSYARAGAYRDALSCYREGRSDCPNTMVLADSLEGPAA